MGTAGINPADEELRTKDEVEVDGVVERETLNEAIDRAGLIALTEDPCDSLPLVP